jgi:predicted alpha/beta-fold hydrolase
VSSQGIAGAVLGSVSTALIMKEARREAKPPRIYMQNSDENLQVLKKIPQLTRPILPPWGWDGVLASGIFTMANGIPLGTSEMEPVKLPDGGLLTLDWLNDKAPLTGPGCVVLFPGTNNSSHSPYVRRIGKVLADAGFNVVAINYRGILANYQSEKLLGLDAWEDFPFAFRQIAIHLTRPCTCPRNPPTDEEIKSVKMFAIGFSLGGTLLARYIIAQAENDFGRYPVSIAFPKLKGAMTISSPLGARQGMMDVHSTWLPWLLACTVAQGRKIEMLSKAITSQKTRQLISKIGWRKFLMYVALKHLTRFFESINNDSFPNRLSSSR